MNMRRIWLFAAAVAATAWSPAAPLEASDSARAEAKIMAALDKTVTVFDFNETPLSDVAARLREDYSIPVVLDFRGLEEATISTDVPITKRLSGISLRSALNLMLRDRGLAWIVTNEVLMITTQEEA